MKKVVAISTEKELKAFIDFPHELYRDDKNYVPELFMAQYDLLSKKKHPFHKHSEVQLFLVYYGAEVTGRIAAILNNNYNSFNNVNEGFFGFFDCVDDQETAHLLITAATDWLKEKGAVKVMGPTCFSTNETCGVLIDGYEFPPAVMMPYNKPYYRTLLEKEGMGKEVDLVSYWVEYADHDPRSVRLLDVLQERLKRSNIVIRTINMKKFAEETKMIKQTYNSAWDKNLGFVPMTDEEFEHMAKDMKMILNPDFCLVAEQDGKCVGFALGVPDLNQVFKKIKRGRLLPTGIFTLLTQRKKINSVRVMALGVIEGYRKLGIEACLYGTIIKHAKKHNLKGGDCGWMLEDNHLMNHAIEQINGKLYRKYRIFQKAI